MKRAVLTLNPRTVLGVTDLPAKEAIAAALADHAKRFSHIYVVEVPDSYQPGDWIPEDTPVLDFCRCSRFLKARRHART